MAREDSKGRSVGDIDRLRGFVLPVGLLLGFALGEATVRWEKWTEEKLALEHQKLLADGTCVQEWTDGKTPIGQGKIKLVTGVPGHFTICLEKRERP